MILHLERSSDELSLRGEAFGEPVPPEELQAALRFLFPGWQAPVLTGRGVLHVLQSVARGVDAHGVVYGPTLRRGAGLLRQVLRVVAAGRVAPSCEGGQARWRPTVLPERADDQPLFRALVDLWMRTCSATVLTRAQARRGTFYTAEDAWLTALRAPVAAVALPSSALGSELARWSAPLYEGGRGALPLHPRRSEVGWLLDFGAPGEALAPATLRLLGQAIAVAPRLALPQPWSDRTFATFLRESVPALRAAAFMVTLPAELEPQVPQVREVAIGLAEGQVRIAQTMLVGGVEVSLAEAQAILDAGETLAYIRGAWRYVDLEALRRALEAVGPATLPRHGALPLLLAGALRIAPEAQDVQDFLREMTMPPEGELPLRDVLRPYQAQGVCWLMQAAAHGIGVCLADDMGLGKTLQTIAFLLSRPGPALVVAPLTVLPVWERELARWAPHLRVRRHEGAGRILAEGFAKVTAANDVTLTAYGYLWRDYASFRRVAWQTLVLDEAQLIKNPNTRQSQAARSLPATFRLALTGTPIENRLDDLWSILDFLNPETFGTRRDFLARYANPERLRRTVAHFLLRRLKSDPGILAELPPKILQSHYAPLTPPQAAAYDVALADYAHASMASAGERQGAILALLTRLKLICDGLLPDASPGDAAALLQHSGKVMVLLPLLEEIFAHGESVLLFTQFTRLGHALAQILAERFEGPIPFLHGALSPRRRREEIARFNEATRPMPLILSLRTGAFGLTLTKANHVIHLDRWWNPAVENQATDRAHRLGQQRTVVVHHLLCRGTLEDRIDRLLREKRALADQIVAPTPVSLLSRLPTDTLLGLLKRTPHEA